MEYTLRIVVKTQQEIEDSNAYLVSKGFPYTTYNAASHLSTDLLVVFKLNDTVLSKEQRFFLDHLGRVGVIKSYRMYSGDTQVGEPVEYSNPKSE